jgi:hypothetical protein
VMDNFPYGQERSISHDNHNHQQATCWWNIAVVALATWGKL